IEKTIFDVCVIGDGNHSSKYPKTSEMRPTGVPFIRGMNLVDGAISDEEMLFISPQKHQELKKGHLKARDILFTNRGDIGKVALVDERFDNSNLNSQIAWLRCRDEVLPEFLFHFLQSGEMKRHFSLTKSGTALQQFTISMLRQVPVSFPAINQQTKIAAALDRVRAEMRMLERIYHQKFEILERLKQSILQKAFSGELTSPSSPGIREAAE